MSKVIDLLGIVKFALGIVALVKTFGTPLFWVVLWLFLELNIKVTLKFR